MYPIDRFVKLCLHWRYNFSSPDRTAVIQLQLNSAKQMLGSIETELYLEVFILTATLNF